MVKYLLDTNILSYLEDPSSLFHQPVREKISSLAYQDMLHVSILTVYELEYGIVCADRQFKENIKRSLRTAKELSIMPLNLQGAAIFGELKKEYKEKSASSKSKLELHNSDLMIASAAISEEAILVSNDRIFEVLKEFHPDFHYENWALV